METSLLGKNGTAASEASLAVALDRLEKRLARIEDALDEVKALSGRAPPMVAAAVDTLDDVARQAQERGIDLDQRARTALALLDRLTEPKTAEMLERLLALSEQAPGLVAMAMDTFDGLVQRAQGAGIDVDARSKNLLSALEKLTSPAALTVLQDLLDRVDIVEGLLASGVLDPAPVAIVSRAGEALAFTGREPPPAIGAWGAFRALSDPDVQRAVGFALRFAQRFGRSLGGDGEARALPSKTD